MFISPKRYIRLASGDVVEAKPGLSGTLVVAEGSELSEQDAIAYGILERPSRPEIMVSQPISRNPIADAAAAKTDEGAAASTPVAPIVKPWETETAPGGLPRALTFGDVPKVDESQQQPQPPAALPINE